MTVNGNIKAAEIFSTFLGKSSKNSLKWGEKVAAFVLKIIFEASQTGKNDGEAVVFKVLRPPK